MYGLRYYSSDYDYYYNTITTKIYKADYAGDAEKIKIIKDSDGITIQYLDKDNFITQNVDIAFLNSSTNIYKYDEIISGYEQDWYCEVIHEDASVVLFKGYLNSEIGEQSIEYKPEVHLNFTDFITRLSDLDVSLFSDSDRISYLELFSGCLGLIGSNEYLTFNNKLYPYPYTFFDPSVSLLERISLDTQLFYKDDKEVDNPYDILMKISKPIDLVTYSFDNAFTIERYNDCWDTSASLWKYNINNIATKDSSVASNRKYLTEGSNLTRLSLNDNKFILKPGATTPNYTAGVKTLKLDLVQDPYYNLINTEMSRKDVSALYNTPPYKVNTPKYRSFYWDEHHDSSLWGTNLYQLSNYAYHCGGSYYWNGSLINDSNDEITEYNPPPGRIGFYVRFPITIDPSAKTALNIKYKTVMPDPKEYHTDITKYEELTVRLMVQLNGIYLKYNDASSMWDFDPTDAGWSDDYIKEYKYNEESYIDGTTRTIEHSETIDFATMNLLKAGDKNVTVTILPTFFKVNLFNDFFAINYANEWIGDVVITCTANNDDNTILYNGDNKCFDKATETFNVYDINNLVYKNGIYYGTYDWEDASSLSNRTTKWVDNPDNYLDPSTSSVWMPLVDIYAKNFMNNHQKSRKQLSGTIKTNTIIKPLDMIKGLNINGEDKTFCIRGYTNKVLHNVYDIVANEYAFTNDVSIK